MNSQTVFNWIQTLTGLAVLAGLGLVVWELQQNREAMQSQLTSDGWQMNADRSLTMLGESPHEVIDKACVEPGSLTVADLNLLNDFYNNLIDTNVRRIVMLSERGSFYDVEYWKLGAPHTLRIILSTPAGRAWWRQVSFVTTPETFKEMGDEILRNGSYYDCSRSRWRSEIAKEIE